METSEPDSGKIDHLQVMAKAHAVHLAGDPSKALDIVYDSIDNLMLHDRFADIDEILKDADPTKLELDLTIGLLTISFPAAHRLPNRKAFYQRVKAHAEAAGELRTEPNLLDGLEGS